MRPALLILPLALVACGRTEQPADDLAALDNQLATAPDPALTSAINDQIMVDPDLQQQSNANAVKPLPRPDDGALPPDPPLTDPVRGTPPAPPSRPDCPDCAAKRAALTPGALAAGQRDGRTAGCAATLGYSASWANRLPYALPIYPGAQLSEAAGTDANGCALRIASFATGAAPAKLLAWYAARAGAAGYSAEQQREGALSILGGARGEAAYLVYASPRPGGGTDVDLLTTGR